jgi:hypothetical protein
MKTDYLLMGIVIGMVLVRANDLLFKYSELYLLNNQRKLSLLLGEAIVKMEEKIKGTK